MHVKDPVARVIVRWLIRDGEREYRVEMNSSSVCSDL